MSEVSDTRLPLTVREVMTPVVYFVRPDTPVTNVIEDLLDSAVHRLFVVDDDEVLIGVISTLDLLQHLRSARPARHTCHIRRHSPAETCARQSFETVCE